MESSRVARSPPGQRRIPLQIDVGFGDVIAPAPVEVEYPTLLAFPAAKLRAYPKESVVAEKFEALIKLGMANSRMKDFYDLWVIARKFEFHVPVMGEALAATFAQRETVLPASRPLAFTPEFSASPAKQRQWRAFLRKSALGADASLQGVVKALDEFLMPVVEGDLEQENNCFPVAPRWSVPGVTGKLEFRMRSLTAGTRAPKTFASRRIVPRFVASNHYQLSLIHPQLTVGSAIASALSPAAILLSRNSK